MHPARNLDFDAAHTIGMQGPFSMDMNVAMLQSFHAEWMVTKESGRNGGFEKKLRQPKRPGVRVVLIGRPKEEEGLSEDEVKRYLVEKFDLSVKRDVVIAGIGPGAEAQAHAPNEKTWKIDLVRCAAVYAALPTAYCK